MERCDQFFPSRCVRLEQLTSKGTKGAMIRIKDLTELDRGRWVEYQSHSGKIERGMVKGWNDQVIFVVYKCDDRWDNFLNFTTAATDPADLTFR